MEISPLVLVIFLVAVAICCLAIGATIAAIVDRRRNNGSADQQMAFDAALSELRGQSDAQMNMVVDRVIALAGDSFDGRLQTGSAELAHGREVMTEQVTGMQRQVVDQLGEVVAKMEAKLEAVDVLVSEKVSGVSDVVGERVGGMSRELTQQVTTMGADLEKLRRTMDQIQRERAEQFGQVAEGLKATVDGQRALNDTTRQLREALASPQARGQWGERMAEDVLRSAGMREGLNYRKQRVIEGGTKPDFTFLLPDERLLHMDVKFPVTNYMRYLSEVDSVDQRTATASKRTFLKDVRSRVSELTGRGYDAPDSTVGFVLLFVPNESVYGFIHENDPALLDDAMAKKVVLCSPTTLFAMLGIVRQSMDTFAVERASKEIVETLARFGSQWVKFSEQIDKVDKHLSQLNNSFGDLSGTRRRALVRQLDRIDDIQSRAGLEDMGLPTLESIDKPTLREVSGQ